MITQFFKWVHVGDRCFAGLAAPRTALLADSASIAIMEIVDNLIMLVIPGAMDAGRDQALILGAASPWRCYWPVPPHSRSIAG